MKRLLAALVTGTLLLAGGCQRGSDAPDPRLEEGASTTTPAAAAVSVPDPQPTPRAHLADAVRDLLEAELKGDRAASFVLLSRSSRVEYKDVADWTGRRQELPAVTGFRIDADSEGDKGDRAGKVLAIVEHTPGLDPFTGLSAAREEQTFTGQRDGKGWLVDADPEANPILPPDAEAAVAASAWVTAVQACDEQKANGLQAIATLYGSSDGAVGLCGKAGSVTVGAVSRLAPGFASADIVAQYTTDALLWTRVVRVESPAAFGVVLAPIGTQWKVLGLTD